MVGVVGSNPTETTIIVLFSCVGIRITYVYKEIFFVIPADAGIQNIDKVLDSGRRQNDEKIAALMLLARNDRSLIVWIPAYAGMTIK